MTNKEEMDNLKKVVDSVFSVDIMKKVNKREFVNGRKVFSKILVDRGFTISEIGRYLKKHHTTIIHYMSDVDGMLKYSPTVFDKYLICKEDFSRSTDDNRLEPKQFEENMYIVSLNSQIEKLILERNVFLERLNHHKRLLPIIEFINKRTRIGDEDFILKRINHMFNGISKYEQDLE
jgi:hypothetical protein